MVTRRATLLGALASLAQPLRAEDVVALEWSDLVPEGLDALPDLQGVIEHGGLSQAQPASTAVRRDWDGRTVSLPGYVLPLEYSGTGVVSFILVPYVGACIHVPPPPAYQLVLVTSARPYEVSGLFEPVMVTGMFGAASASTQLAEIGYALSADKIAPYEL